MIKHRLLIILLFFVGVGFSQIRPSKKIKIDSPGVISNRMGNTKLDSLANSDEFKVELSAKTTYKDYKVIPFSVDTVYVDTTLTIKKDYKFNYIRKDDFELLPFHNQGQTYNKLAYNFNKLDLYPNSGARAKHYNYSEIEDVKYYQVATPFTELMYRGGLEQGQVLDALITLNFTKRQNISLNYKGLRSLGKYRKSLASHGNMLFTYTYKTKNDKYHLRTHVAAQELYNEENGGLNTQAVINFEADEADFKDRGRLETNFLDANNILRANRYYLNHDYDLVHKKDSIKTKYRLKAGHVFTYNTKHYQYFQTKNNDYFGAAFRTEITDANHLTETKNQINVSLESGKILGDLKLFIDHYKYKYSFRGVTVINNKVIPQSIDGNMTSTGAAWNTFYKGIAIQAKAATSFAGNLNANYFSATGSYTKDSLFVLKATIANNNKSPNYNFLINQSDYLAYNWQNSNFKNELTRTLLFELESEKLLNASAQITQLDNYTYFDEALSQQTKAVQYTGTVNYLKVKASKSFRYKWFTLDNTIMYQKVTDGESVFRVPEFVTRNTLYYSNSIFKHKPMYIQAGVGFKYFTKYYANAYNPLISEFYLQNNVEIGAYPVIDVFVNARVRSMRLFLKAEHINTLFSNKRDYFSAPNYPYRDYVLRFGVVWNFFI